MGFGHFVELLGQTLEAGQQRMQVRSRLVTGTVTVLVQVTLFVIAEDDFEQLQDPRLGLLARHLHAEHFEVLGVLEVLEDREADVSRTQGAIVLRLGALTQTDGHDPTIRILDVAALEQAVQRVVGLLVEVTQLLQVLAGFRAKFLVLGRTRRHATEFFGQHGDDRVQAPLDEVTQ